MPYANAGEAIATRLRSATATTTARGRVRPTLPTQDEKGDWVVYRRISGGGDVTLDGRSTLQQYVYRVDILADTEARAEAILTAVNHPATGLPGWSDRANGVQGVFPVDDADSDVLDDGSRFPGQSFSIWFEG